MVERPACEVLDEDFRLGLASVLSPFAEEQRQNGQGIGNTRFRWKFVTEVTGSMVRLGPE